MNTELLPADSPTALDRALQILRGGGLVAFPTDTVYGVGALAFDGPAVQSIYPAKDRPPEKAIPILIGDAEDVGKVAISVSDLARRLAWRFWPGPLTLIVRKRPQLPEAVSATDTVGVRLPDHALARALLQLAGPMAVTSANISSQPSPCTAQEVLDQLNGRIPLVLDGGKTPGGIPSTVVDCTQPRAVILRAGPLTAEDIESALI